MRFEILEEGEEALLYKYDGNVKLERGPKRILLIRSILMKLRCFTAQHDEYLKIKFRDGKVEHRRGPCNLTLNTQIHESIVTDKCFCLDANQVLVVYGRKDKDTYERKIVRGPEIYMLSPNEWVHKFSWHGNEDNKTAYVANANNFNVLNCAPNHLYYNVDEVRTSDDALIRIKLMIFYELKNIELMLKETKDPIGDMINCCCADVVSYTQKRTYLSFIGKCYELNELSNYEKLVKRAQSIGFEITKVVFRGYFASPELQLLHDNSIQTRKQLELEYESVLQEQIRQDLNLKSEMDRLKFEQNLQAQKVVHEHEIEKKKLEANLKLKTSQTLDEIDRNKQIKLSDLQAEKERNLLSRNHLTDLKKLDIDLTKYLLASSKSADHIIQIQQKNFKTNSNESNGLIHFHEHKTSD